MRALLIWLGPADYLLVVGMHHIVADGWSLGVFAGELEALYTASVLGRPPGLAELPVQYGDFAVWQRSAAQARAARRAARVLAHDARATSLRSICPPTSSRPSVQAHRGGVVAFAVPEDPRGATRRAGAITRRDPVHGRARRLRRRPRPLERDGRCGRRRSHRLSRAPSRRGAHRLLRQHAGATRRPQRQPDVHRAAATGPIGALDAYAHQDVPFERLVEELRPPRDLSRNPLVQVMFQLFESAHDPTRLGARSGRSSCPAGGALFDLRVDLVPLPGRFAGRVEYDRDLFEGQTVERLAQRYVALLHQLVENPALPDRVLRAADG